MTFPERRKQKIEMNAISLVLLCIRNRFNAIEQVDLRKTLVEELKPVRED